MCIEVPFNTGKCIDTTTSFSSAFETSIDGDFYYSKDQMKSKNTKRCRSDVTKVDDFSGRDFQVGRIPWNSDNNGPHYFRI